VSERRPAVTVIMPVCNGERFVREALDSLLAQTFDDFVVIVIDDASIDSTREIVGRYGDPRVHLVSNPVRVGPAAARNRGLEQAQSRYVAFLDSDDVAEPRRLERQVDFLRGRPEIGLVASRATIIDDDGRPTGEVWGWNGPDELIAPSMFFRNYLPTSTILVDRAALGDERFDPTLEVASDYDMWLRVIDRTGAASLPEPLARYRIHAANLTHQRRQISDVCLERIERRQLARLGIEPSQSEMATHHLVATGRLQGTSPFLNAAATWLARIDVANRTSNIYPVPLFGHVIEGEWLAACDAVAQGGCWDAWPTIARSPLTRRLLAVPRGRRGLAPLPWRTLRGYVRRRWPAVGSMARTLRSKTKTGIRHSTLQAL
jgi:glycosyltransferase involved in cell wall biosynthesis